MMMMSHVMQESTSSVGSETSVSNINSIFAKSILEKVINSWELIKPDKDAVGLDFFVRVIVENPELLRLFSFGPGLLSSVGSNDAEALEERLRNSRQLDMHARTVMAFVGRGIEGLSDIDSFIPDLRAVGSTHQRVGVDAANYDAFFRNLMLSFANHLGRDWDQETADAWANIYFGMTTVMDQPEVLNQTEPLVGWGIWLAAANLFIVFGTPWRLAGFSVPLPLWASLALDAMDFVSAIILMGDLISSWIVHRMKAAEITLSGGSTGGGSFSNRKSNNNNNQPKKSFLRRSIARMIDPFKYRIFRLVYGLHLEQWVPWPRLDTIILVSYLIQNLNRFHRQQLSPASLVYADTVGVSWLHMIGLVRIAAVWRLTYVARCAENETMLRQATSDRWRTVVTVFYLLTTLIYVTHVSACLYCIVVRVELGPGWVAEGSNGMTVASGFFPDAGILLSRSGVMRSYLSAIYWAWVNLAGIGNVDSSPEKPLEICIMLLIHMCGATLYAIITGNVVNILEQVTAKENKIGDDIAELRAFMEECELAPDEQENILRGYVTQGLMRNNASGGGDDYYRNNGVAALPDLGEDIGRRLPTHFREDLELHALAVGMKRCNPVLKNVSTEFLFALAGKLKGKVTLLPGDYLFQTNDEVPRRFLMIQKGNLAIIAGESELVGTLQRGSVVGFGWLTEATLLEELKTTFPEPCVFSDWLDISSDGTNMNRAGVSIRATSDCVIATGLTSTLEVEALRRRFPQEVAVLEAQRIAAEADSQRRKVKRFKAAARSLVNLKTSRKIEQPMYSTSWTDRTTRTRTTTTTRPETAPELSLLVGEQSGKKIILGNGSGSGKSNNDNDSTSSGRGRKRGERATSSSSLRRRLGFLRSKSR